MKHENELISKEFNDFPPVYLQLELCCAHYYMAL